MSVTYVPYNPWKEQLLASLVPTFLNQIRESEKNKKMNALLGELANPNRQAAQVPDGTMPQTGQGDANSITAPGMAQPLDLSSIRSVNPASANPASTSSSMNANASAGASNAAIEQMLSQASMQGNHVTNFSDLFSLLGTPRFNGVNSAEAIANATPFLQEIAAAEQARQQALAEQQQRERAMAYMQQYPSEQTVGNLLQYLLGGHASQSFAPDIVKAAMGVIDQNGARAIDFNAGNRQILQTLNPLTGELGNATQYMFGLNPTQKYSSDVSERNSIRSANASNYATSAAAKTAANRLAFDTNKFALQHAFDLDQAAIKNQLDRDRFNFLVDKFGTQNELARDKFDFNVDQANKNLELKQGRLDLDTRKADDLKEYRDNVIETTRDRNQETKEHNIAMEGIYTTRADDQREHWQNVDENNSLRTQHQIDYDTSRLGLAREQFEANQTLKEAENARKEAEEARKAEQYARIESVLNGMPADQAANILLNMGGASASLLNNMFGYGSSGNNGGSGKSSGGMTDAQLFSALKSSEGGNDWVAALTGDTSKTGKNGDANGGIDFKAIREQMLLQELAKRSIDAQGNVIPPSNINAPQSSPATDDVLTLIPIGDGLWQDEKGRKYTDKEIEAMYNKK